MKRRYALIVQGETKQWLFEIEADPRAVEDWRADGLALGQIVNTVPKWVADWKLTRQWCFLQDLFYFKNPFK